MSGSAGLADLEFKVADVRGLGIRAKLIIVFVVIKVIPLLVLAYFAWQGQRWLAERVSENLVQMTDSMRGTVDLVANATTQASVKALDDAAREAQERLTTDTARAVATFLYDRDGDILTAALLPPAAEEYDRFLSQRRRAIERHHPWVLSPDGTQWIPGPDALPRYDQPPVRPSTEENARNFNYRPPEGVGLKEDRPLFLEMTFVGLDGRERVKVTTSGLVSAQLNDVSLRANTFVKAEDYFQALQALKPGEVYVSPVIGAYVSSPIVGPFTTKAAAAKGIPFAPEQAGFAGTENPVGQRFRGLVRWATPVMDEGKVVGWVTLALDHDHLMEFTDHIVPTVDRYSPLPDAASGNYAFIWDNEGRSIVHPRHYFITGYDPETGEPAVPWLDAELYAQWKASGKSIRDFLATAPKFNEQSLKKKGSAELVKAGLLGLDCRYLNHAPQCTGWMDLTQHGGSGSFEIFWSGLWKLNTAAAIPYYTGPYGASARGFGFVTIGSNVDDFHRAAVEARVQANEIMAERDRDLKVRLGDVLALVSDQLASIARQLTVSTAIMILLVIGIAVWMAWALTRRITAVVTGIRRFESGDLAYRLPTQGGDEMADLNRSFNEMADRVKESITRLELARDKAEEASKSKTEFLASMSHELRTPLNGIIGFAQLLREDAQNDEARENAEIIETSSHHLLLLLNSILDIAKIEAGEMNVVAEAVPLRALVAEVTTVHLPVAAAKQVGFEVRLDDDLPANVVADPTKLRQVLHNLLNNAVKFTEHGSVILEVTRQTPDVLFRVIDTGPGIPDHLREAVFEKFRQGDDFLTRRYQGTGLGLTLARHLTDLMGGRMGLETELGKGSVFHFTLPAGTE